MRGGTYTSACFPEPRPGLSPLARGNRLGERLGTRRRGPIPACAGEPALGAVRHRAKRAYPRLRGGTVGEEPVRREGRGLSPLARGNLPVWSMISPTMGPIPACAGEPGISGQCRHNTRAYPRLRGGTGSNADGVHRNLGLSPLARGNLGPITDAGYTIGPIPACAGEPYAELLDFFGKRAYPRLRGGTMNITKAQAWAQGLSPLARGNRCCHHATGLQQGPIPACAGEPF